MSNLPLAIFIGALKETYIYQIGGIMFERITKNLRTTMAAVIPAVVAVGAHFGLKIPAETLTLCTAAVYMILLLFSKDTPKEE